VAKIETFQDGEPADPLKLASLQDQIRELRDLTQKAFNLSDSNDTEEPVYSVKSGVVTFENVKSGADPQSEQIDSPWEESKFESVYTTATVRLANPKRNNVRVSLTGSQFQPIVKVYYEGPAKDSVINELNVHWVSVAKLKFI